MRVDLAMHDRWVTYLVSTLCSYGDRGDFQAHPTEPLNLDLPRLAQHIAANGAAGIRSDGVRILLEWRGANVMLFSSGRMILENLRPARQTAAAEFIRDLFGAAAAG